MIKSYNALIDTTNPNFSSVSGYFSLYHVVGNTFHVIVMQSANTSGFVTLNFIPIGGNEPNITMDYNDTFDNSVTTHALSIQGEFTVLEGITILFTNTITRIDLALGLLSSDITGDNGTNSRIAAQKLYNSDRSNIPQPVKTVPNPPDDLHAIVSWIANNPVIVLIVLFFGGFVGFYQFGRGTIQWFRKHFSREQLKDPHEERNRRRKARSK